MQAYAIDLSQPAAPAKPRKEPTALRAAQTRQIRERNLAWSLSAMQALFRCDREPRVMPEAADHCASLYTEASAELAALRGELGLFDQDRIGTIAELFGVDPALLQFVWEISAATLMSGAEKRTEAAHKALDETGLAAIAHRPLVDLKTASRVFLKTPGRDRHLFGKRLGRTRIRTGMPNYDPPGNGVSAVPDGPGTDRFTTAQRKALAAELGIKTKTVRENELKRTPEDFETWADRLRKAAATKAQKAAEKEARAGKRRRKPGKMTAVHRWIEWTAYYRERRYSERQALRILQGLTARQVLNLIPPAELVCIGGSTGPTIEADVSDKDASDAFGKMHRGEHDHCHDVSNNVSDKNPSGGAFSDSFEHHRVPSYEATDTAVAAPSAELSDTLDAWARLHEIPDTATAIKATAQLVEWHRYLDRTRALIRTPMPTADEHETTMANLRAGADDAWEEYGRVVGF